MLAAFYPFSPNEAAETFCCSGCGVRGRDTGVCHCCHMTHQKNPAGKIRCRACRFGMLQAVEPLAGKAGTGVAIRVPSSLEKHGLAEIAGEAGALVKCPFCPLVSNAIDVTVTVNAAFCCSGCGIRGRDTGVCHCCHKQYADTPW